MTDVTMHEDPKSLSANVQIDDVNRILTINGVHISADLLESLTESTRDGEWFRVVREGDKSTVHVRRLDQRYLAQRSTHTVVTMDLSQAAYDEIAQKLRDAGYEHVFGEADMIDLTGIAAVPPQGDL